jgi:beta-N-acetylhexosaminidase
MTAHVLYPKIDPNNPATLSRRIVGDFLRGELGYDGVVFSDDFLMKAIADNHDLTDAARTFFAIGGDVVLICKRPELSLEIIQRLKSECAANEASDLRENLRQAAQRIENLKRQFFPSFHVKADLASVTKQHQDFVKTCFLS